MSNTRLEQHLEALGAIDPQDLAVRANAVPGADMNKVARAMMLASPGDFKKARDMSPVEIGKLAEALGLSTRRNMRGEIIG